MKKNINVLAVCLFFIIAISLMATMVSASFYPFGNIFQPPALQSQPLAVPTQTNKGDILIDNFEYWDSPYNHGWVQVEPPYPVYGYGIGYATVFNTVLDLQEGSRVLDVYRPASVFIIGTPYERHAIKYACGGCIGIDLDTHPVLSFKFRAPLGIEPWDIFQFNVTGATKNGVPFAIQIRPLQANCESGNCSSTCTTGNSAKSFGTYTSTLLSSPALNNASSVAIDVQVGRKFLDGSWHIIWIDLADVQNDAYKCAGVNLSNDETIGTVCELSASGQMFRLDDIIFRKNDYLDMDQPDLFEIGPLFAQIFEPYRYLFMSDYQAIGTIQQMGARQLISDLMLDVTNFIVDPNAIRAAWEADLTALSIDTNYADPNSTLYGQKVDLLGNGSSFTIDINLPVFSDANLRIAGNKVDELQKHGVLGWNATIGGYGSNGIQTMMINPLPINPYDGMPTYIPAYYSSVKAVKAYGVHHYGPALCFMLESALFNSGVALWPNIAYIDYTPQVFEDLIVTLEVTDGRRSDVRTIPISVVNYPVENYPPVVQIYASPFIFYVGQYNEYIIKWIDPDCYIFSMAHLIGRQPATTHVVGWPFYEVSPYAQPQNIRTDQDTLTYNIALDGMPTYQYGPWIYDMIDPKSGLISFTPKFEGKYSVLITCTDAYGAVGHKSFPLLVVQSGTWLNHPPFITGCPTRPVVIRAGEEFIMTAPDFIVTDPDGDQLYASCNIGSCGQTADGNFMYSFQSNFPGAYNLEIIFYDIRGGYAIMKLLLDVKPWWSY